MPPKRASTSTAPPKPAFGAASKRTSTSASAKSQLVGAKAGKGKAAAELTPQASRASSPEKKLTQAQLDSVKDLPDLDAEDPSYNKIWEHTKERMGKPTYEDAVSQDRIKHILRVFDFDPQYGPALGLTRLERWERARNLGDDPPHEIREILQTKQGTLLPEYRECVLAGLGV